MPSISRWNMPHVQILICIKVIRADASILRFSYQLVIFLNKKKGGVDMEYIYTVNAFGKRGTKLINTYRDNENNITDDSDKEHYAHLLESRKKIEKRIMVNIMRRNAETICVFEIMSSNTGRLLSYSPYTANNNTSMEIPRRIGYYYSHLSQALHDVRDERYEVEVKIDKILPIDVSYFTFAYFNKLEEILSDKRELIKYCNTRKIAIPSDSKCKELRRLIARWRFLSSDCHYKMTKQQKRKLKKLNAITAAKSFSFYNDYKEDI